MRIVAGSAKGRTLRVPREATRPTTDRVREAIFSKLMWDLEGARVVDLFAGSGALGLEALSRGALFAELVESERQACGVIQANAERCGLASQARTLATDVFRFLRGAPVAGWDLVFADPPWQTEEQPVDLAGQLLRSEGLRRGLKAEGLLVLEQQADWEWGEGEAFWERFDERSYGKSAIHYFRPRKAQS
ncbi:MAG: 16S rRNA (guanine(966)-N(2))-methyltransferase RsmD [Verrucomicrobiota bacterium]